MSGLRVMELTKQLLEKGFDEEEADCGGVVVESASMVMDYNVAACAGDPLLLATVDGKQLQFGSLSHSHLNQVLKNISASLKIPEGEQGLHMVVGPSGAIEMALLKMHDSTFERYAREGCLFEVLAAKIDTEEPEAADIISAAA